ncbi:MAG: hypothetical protein P8144_14570, partial [Gammaproteobacteria bacterium]
PALHALASKAANIHDVILALKAVSFGLAQGNLKANDHHTQEALNYVLMSARDAIQRNRPENMAEQLQLLSELAGQCAEHGLLSIEQFKNIRAHNLHADGISELRQQMQHFDQTLTHHLLRTDHLVNTFSQQLQGIGNAIRQQGSDLSQLSQRQEQTIDKLVEIGKHLRNIRRIKTASNVGEMVLNAIPFAGPTLGSIAQGVQNGHAAVKAGNLLDALKEFKNASSDLSQLTQDNHADLTFGNLIPDLAEIEQLPLANIAPADPPLPPAQGLEVTRDDIEAARRNNPPPQAAESVSSGLLTIDENNNPLLAAIKFDYPEAFDEELARSVSSQEGHAQTRAIQVKARDDHASSALDIALHYGRPTMLNALIGAEILSTARDTSYLRATREVEDRVNMYNNRGRRIDPVQLSSWSPIRAMGSLTQRLNQVMGRNWFRQSSE